MRVLAAAIVLAAAPAFADGADTSAPLRKRFDPGFGVSALADVRGYELGGSAAGAGVGVSYAWDLVGVNLELVQGLSSGSDPKPTFVRGGFDFALFTLSKFSGLGVAGVTFASHGAGAQTDGTGGAMIGPDLGLGARFRATPHLDVFARATAGIWEQTSGSRRMYFEPGGSVGVRFYPWGSEE